VLHLRYLIRPLTVVALAATALSLAAGSASAQDLKVFTFTNAEEVGSDWEVRASVESFGGCGVSDGRDGGTSGWLQRDDQWGIVLDLDCSYTITAVARNETAPAVGTDQKNYRGMVCKAELGWGAEGTATELRTRSDDRGTETDVSVTVPDVAADRVCDSAIVVTFNLDPATVVEDLPASAADSALEDRAERAVEATAFRVTVRPQDSTKNKRGCNQVLVFDVKGGDDGKVERPLPGIPSGVDCSFLATVTSAPAPFNIANASGKSFNTGTAGGNISVELASLVRLPWGRISIVQDVTGSNNQGEVSYRVERTCAGADVLPPTIRTGGAPGIYTRPGGQVVATLAEGRFTVHSNNFANFGAGANYLAVARSMTSNAVDGCSVSVTVLDPPATCRVAPAMTQRLEWRSGSPFDNFDFEFDFVCGGGSLPTTVGTGDELPPPVTPSPPAAGDSTGTSTDTSTTTTAPDPATDTVRLVARLLENGKIEFGLQQWQHDGDWSDRIFPRARLYPADTAVGRWLVSSAITLSVSDSASAFADDTHVRIIARKLSDGRVEFGLQQSDDGGSTWGEQMLPTRRYFPASATALRWLGSSNITIDG